MRNRSIISVVFGLRLIQVHVSALSTHRSPVDNKNEDFSGTPHKLVSTNFWQSSISTREGTDSNDRIPCVDSLDEGGPLPLGSYLNFGEPCFYPKPTCRIMLNIDVGSESEELEPKSVVKNLQSFIDGGFTTFSLSGTTTAALKVWMESEVYGRLLDMTPSFVLETCQLMVPYEIPSHEGPVSSQSIRGDIVASLRNIGGEAIDTLQLISNDGSPYHNDVLDVVRELQREGLVRSTMAQHWSVGTLRSAESDGFRLDSSQIQCNLLESAKYSFDRKLLCSDLHLPLAVSGALAGGFLTNRHVGELLEPRRFAASERQHLPSLKEWSAELVGSDSSGYWADYQFKLLPVLERIALKYRVSIADVALRWTLQLEHVQSTFVSSSFVTCDDSSISLTERQQDLRRVFTFSLDHEDLTMIGKVSRTMDEVSGQEFDLEELEQMSANENGLILP